MPWTCPNTACGAQVELDSLAVCPTCETEKTAWTFGQRTRTLVIPRHRKLEVRRGRTLRTAKGALHAHVGVAWRTTTAASALAVEHARALMERGELPDPRDLVCVRLFPAAGARSVRFTPLYEARGTIDVELVFDADAEAGDRGWFAVHALCVHGPGVEEVSFPHVRVIDVTDDTPSGHAPQLEVSTLRTKAVTLTLEAVTPPAAPSPTTTLRVRVHDASWTPVAGAPYTLRGAQGHALRGTTDAEGWLEEETAPGEHALEVTPAGRAPLRLVVRAGAAAGQDGWYHQHVRNLGFAGKSEEEALYGFQLAHDLERSGRLDGPTRAAVESIVRGEGASLRERLGKS